jgi:hypothetical protein
VLSTIATQDDLHAWINETYPLLTSSEISTLLSYYGFTSTPSTAAYVSFFIGCLLNFEITSILGYVRRINTCLPKLLVG